MLTDEIRERWNLFKRFDRNLFYYQVLLIVIVLVFHQSIPAWGWAIAEKVTIILLLFIAIPFLEGFNNAVAKFFRYTYIVFAFPFLYWQVGPLLHAVFPGEFDPFIIGLDTSIWGVLPNIWVQKWVHPLLTEIMQIGYSIYWITIPLSAGIFYFRKKLSHYEYLMNMVTITFFVSYLMFIFFPVAGPRFYIAEYITASYKGLWVADFLRGFVKTAGYRGGAFPSSHVAVAVAILVYMLKFERSVALKVFLPMVVMLSLATVYGQYHYLFDVTFGLIMGVVFGRMGVVWATAKIDSNSHPKTE
ncbi:MAG: phosphatase PAP2 family protein [Calditrichia bacterium]